MAESDYDPIESRHCKLLQYNFENWDIAQRQERFRNVHSEGLESRTFAASKNDCHYIIIPLIPLGVLHISG